MTEDNTDANSGANDDTQAGDFADSTLVGGEDKTSTNDDKTDGDKTLVGGEDTPKEGDKTDGDKTDGDKTDGDKTDGDEAGEVPETYDLTLEGDVKVEEALLDDFAEYAKGKKLTQEEAQKHAQVLAEFSPVIDKYIADKQMAAIAEQSKEWRDSMKVDKELGGDNLAENLAKAKQSLKTFGSDTFAKMLGKFDPETNPTGTGLGDHPEVIRFLVETSKVITEGEMKGAGGKGGEQRSVIEKLYPTMDKK